VSRSARNCLEGNILRSVDKLHAAHKRGTTKQQRTLGVVVSVMPVVHERSMAPPAPRRWKLKKWAPVWMQVAMRIAHAHIL
jgi:hypothetical protein